MSPSSSSQSHSSSSSLSLEARLGNHPAASKPVKSSNPTPLSHRISVSSPSSSSSARRPSATGPSKRRSSPSPPPSSRSQRHGPTDSNPLAARLGHPGGAIGTGKRASGPPPSTSFKSSLPARPPVPSASVKHQHRSSTAKEDPIAAMKKLSVASRRTASPPPAPGPGPASSSPPVRSSSKDGRASASSSLSTRYSPGPHPHGSYSYPSRRSPPIGSSSSSSSSSSYRYPSQYRDDSSSYSRSRPIHGREYEYYSREHSYDHAYERDSRSSQGRSQGPESSRAFQDYRNKSNGSHGTHETAANKKDASTANGGSLSKTASDMKGAEKVPKKAPEVIDSKKKPAPEKGSKQQQQQPSKQPPKQSANQPQAVKQGPKQSAKQTPKQPPKQPLKQQAQPQKMKQDNEQKRADMEPAKMVNTTPSDQQQRGSKRRRSEDDDVVIITDPSQIASNGAAAQSSSYKENDKIIVDFAGHSSFRPNTLSFKNAAANAVNLAQYDYVSGDFASPAANAGRSWKGASEKSGPPSRSDQQQFQPAYNADQRQQQQQPQQRQPQQQQQQQQPQQQAQRQQQPQQRQQRPPPHLLEKSVSPNLPDDHPRKKLRIRGRGTPTSVRIENLDVETTNGDIEDLLKDLGLHGAISCQVAPVYGDEMDAPQFAVATIKFKSRDDAQKCVDELHGVQADNAILSAEIIAQDPTAQRVSQLLQSHLTGFEDDSATFVKGRGFL